MGGNCVSCPVHCTIAAYSQLFIRWYEGSELLPGIHDDYFHPFDPRRCTSGSCACKLYDAYAMTVYKTNRHEAVAIALDDYESTHYPSAWREHPHQSWRDWVDQMLDAQSRLHLIRNCFWI